MSFDILQDKIRAMKNPTVAGLDARIEYVPEYIRKAAFEEYGVGLKGAAEAIWQFNVGLIDALCDIVPAVKPQAAYYENLGWQGMEMLERTIAYAKSKGMFVIADIKRGDIGSTASAYAEAVRRQHRGPAVQVLRRRLCHPERLHGLRLHQALPGGRQTGGQVRLRTGQDLQPRFRRAAGHRGR